MPKNLPDHWTQLIRSAIIQLGHSERVCIFLDVNLVILDLQVTPTMRFLLPSTTFRAVWGGALLGYIMYDLGHYFLHFGTPFTDYLFKLKVRKTCSIRRLLFTPESLRDPEWPISYGFGFERDVWFFDFFDFLKNGGEIFVRMNEFRFPSSVLNFIGFGLNLMMN